MSRKSFDDGHQNAGHKFGKTDSYGFNLNFNEMHNLFHGHREVVSDVARDEGISFDEAAGFVPDAIAEVDADNLENYEANDLGDLVDPQNDTYEEEGTHGVPLAIGSAVKAYGKFRKTPAGKAVEAKAIEKGTEIAGKAIVAAKDKLKGKGGAGLASPDSEGVGTPDSDDPFA